MGVRKMQVALFDKFQHRPFGQLVEALLRHHPLLACVLSEEEIKDDAHQRHKRQHQQPCHGLGRLAVVHQHFHHGCHGNQAVSDEYEPVDVNHLRKGFVFFLAKIGRNCDYSKNIAIVFCTFAIKQERIACIAI